MPTPKRDHSSLTPPPTITRPKASSQQPYFPLTFLRDTLSIPTWLALGAVLQTLLFISPIRRTYAVAPAVLFLAWGVVDTALVSYGITRNRMMDGIVPARVTAVFPDEKGKFSREGGGGKGKTPGGEGVVVFLLGFKINHPLGPLAPGVKNIMSYMVSMFDDLHANAPSNGYLGHTNYLGAGTSATKSEITTMYYFRSTADVHAFAHAPLHKKGWDWFAATTKQYPHLGIMHELYWSGPGAWENVYVNWKPSLMGATSHQFTEEGGEKRWMSPIVEAKGRLRTSAGRIGMDGAGEEEEGKKEA